MPDDDERQSYTCTLSSKAESANGVDVGESGWSLEGLVVGIFCGGNSSNPFVSVVAEAVVGYFLELFFLLPWHFPKLSFGWFATAC